MSKEWRQFKIIREFEEVIEGFNKGSQKVNTRGIIAQIYKDSCFVLFEVRMNAKFCCCKNGQYFFKKIEAQRKTQSCAGYIFYPSGFHMFKIHLDELPEMYSIAIEELISKSSKCCTN